MEVNADHRKRYSTSMFKGMRRDRVPAWPAFKNARYICPFRRLRGMLQGSTHRDEPTQRQKDETNFEIHFYSEKLVFWNKIKLNKRKRLVVLTRYQHYPPLPLPSPVEFDRFASWRTMRTEENENDKGEGGGKSDRQREAEVFQRDEMDIFL